MSRLPLAAASLCLLLWASALAAQDPLWKSPPDDSLLTGREFVDHLFFVAEHDDHHLARIWELVNVHDR